jgi:hypothetical protein
VGVGVRDTRLVLRSRESVYTGESRAASTIDVNRGYSVNVAVPNCLNECHETSRSEYQFQATGSRGSPRSCYSARIHCEKFSLLQLLTREAAYLSPKDGAALLGSLTSKCATSTHNWSVQR